MRSTTRTAAVVAIAVLGTSGVAAAADLPVLAPPPLLTWTGFYAGLNAGVGWGTSSARSTGTSLLDEQAAFTAAGATDPTSLFTPGSTASASTGSSRANAFGFLAGGQIGFNYQPVGTRMVLGVEADLQGADISGHGTFVGHSTDTFAATSLTFDRRAQSTNYAEALSAAWGNPSFTRTATGTDRISSRVGWLGTVRGRLGYLVTPDLLLYATGGLAYGGASASGDYGLDVNYRLGADSFALGYVQASGPAAVASATASALTGYANVVTSGGTTGNPYQTSIVSSNNVTTNGGTALNATVIATPIDSNTATGAAINQTAGTTSTALYTATAPGQSTTTFTHATIVPTTVTGSTSTQGSSTRYSQTRLGITIGGGAEWRFAPNWSLKGEALYYNLGTQTIVGPALTSAPNIVTAMLPTNSQVLDPTTAQKIVNMGGTQNVTNRTVTKVRFDGVLLRAGINYHF